MAITTLDGLIGGKKDSGYIFKTANLPTAVAGSWLSYWAATAIPAAGTLNAGNTTAGVIPNEATTGAMAFANPVPPALSYVMGAVVNSTVIGVVMVYDRVYALGALTPTSGAYPGPVTGTPVDRPASGEGLEIWAEVVTALSAAAHTVTITYTNSEGVPNRTATLALVASAGIGRMFSASLQEGDSGVRQITGVSGSASPPSGTFNLLLVRPILRTSTGALNNPARLGIPEAGLRPLYPGSCLAVAFYNPAGTTAPTILASLDLTTG